MAFRPSVSTVILWSSPTNAGTEVIRAVAFSGPMVARDCATATLTFVGSSAIAS